MIYLFDKNLDLKQIILRDGVVSAVRTEQTSGASLLSIELREDADVSGILYVGHFDTVNLKRFYVYRILSTKFNKDCWEIEGVDLAYDDLSVSLIKDIRPTNKTPSEILEQILEGTMWGVGDVDPAGTITTNYYYQTKLACVQDLCKLTGAILSPSYGFDGKAITSRQISLLWSVGEDRGKRFVHGSNLISVVQENDNSTIYTALIGRGSGVAIVDDEGEETGGYSRKITFGDVEWSVAAGDPVDKPLGQEYVEIPEYTAAYGLLDGKPRVGIVEFDGEEDPVSLLERTYQRVLVSGRPQVSYKAVVRDVGDVGLDDTVAIIRPLPSGNDIRYKTKVYKRVVDLLMPQSSVLYFGDVVQNYVSGKLSDLGEKIALQERSTIGLIDLIKQGKIKAYWGEDGYNYDLTVGNEYGLPAGLYSFDRPINEDPTKFVYVGAGKVVISNEKNPDGSWVLKTFLDGDGLATGMVTADHIVAGVLRAVDGDSGFDLEAPRIWMTSEDGKVTWEASPDNPLTIKDDLGNFLAGIIKVGQKYGLTSSFMSNTPDLSGGYANIGYGTDGGTGIEFQKGNKKFLFTFAGGSGESSMQLYINGTLIRQWGVGGAAQIINDGRGVLRLSILDNGSFSIYDKTGSRLRLSILDDGSFHIFDKTSTQPRLTILDDGSFRIYDKTGLRLRILDNGSCHIYDKNNVIRLWIDANGNTFMQNAEYSHAIGVDNSGPYFIKNNVKSYLGKVEEIYIPAGTQTRFDIPPNSARFFILTPNTNNKTFVMSVVRFSSANQYVKHILHDNADFSVAKNADGSAVFITPTYASRGLMITT